MTRAQAEIPLIPASRLLGHRKEVEQDTLALLARLGAEGGDICRVRFAQKTMIFVSAPALVREVLLEKASIFDKHPTLHASLTPFVGLGSFTSRGAEWSQQRQRSAPQLGPEKIAPYAEIAARSTARLLDGWREGERVDVAAEMSLLQSGILCEALFGADPLGEARALVAALNVAVDLGAKRASLPALAQVIVANRLSVLAPKMGPLQRWAAEISERLSVPGMLSEEVAETASSIDRGLKQLISAHDGAGAHVLARMLEAPDAASSHPAIRDELATLYVVGCGTTAAALTWSLHHLSRAPELQRRARAEGVAFARQVLDETLRLFPSTPVFGRQARESTSIGPYAVEAGTIVLISPYAIHRRPELWPEPDRFDPDRFAPGRAPDEYGYLPFSAGPRACAGKHLTLLVGPIVLAAIAARVRLEPEGECAPDAQDGMKPRPRMLMRVL